MDEKTLKALKDAIEDWEDIRDGELDLSVHDCPLCKLFQLDIWDRRHWCCGCPIFKVTGQILCDGTPFEDYLDNETPENAQHEIDFLRSLLPEEEK